MSINKQQQVTTMMHDLKKNNNFQGLPFSASWLFLELFNQGGGIRLRSTPPDFIPTPLSLSSLARARSPSPPPLFTFPHSSSVCLSPAHRANHNCGSGAPEIEEGEGG